MDEECQELLGLHDLSFKQAFVRFVCQASEVLEAINSVQAETPSFRPSPETIIRYWTYNKHPRWPVIAEPRKWAFDLTQEVKAKYTRVRGKVRILRKERKASSPEMQEYYLAVFGRYETLVSYLATGKLVAKGRERPIAEEKLIPSELWTYTHTRVGIESCTLGRTNTRKWVQVAEGLKIYHPSKLKDKACLPKQAGSGRPKKYLWDEAYDALVLRLGQEGFPENGAELVSMFLDGFQYMRGASVPDAEQARTWLKKKKTQLWRRVVDGDG
ncbi:hypothetical protein PsAD2_00494 [Pseudovibrio axinellae]|uniref:Uncharacterized protein n=1 Tax=Pseudovibrio axinellae TaxID=989403 RepID=A0A166AJQ6_9HYPH|nr:hypothetical protein [Pseudovibrio axinellae]KZL21205.1 hypothetical protein PsAD2_00494 [Pseudovibrio axinellae]SEQ91901.1 hypothetical protein SAMN05421798_105117 [Pseudovibrio axinellae]